MNTLTVEVTAAPDTQSALKNPFPVLTVADEPATAQFLRWLRGVMKAFENWGEPEPDDVTEYGSFVRNAGLLAAYLGFDDLYSESLETAPTAPREAFGAITPVCSQDDAYLFFAKCISKALSETRTQAAVGAQLTTSKHADDSDDLDDSDSAKNGAMPLRFAHALEWETQAKIREGSRCPDPYIFAWAKRNRANFDLPLPTKYKTFSRYLRAGRKFLEAVQNDAVDTAIRKAMPVVIGNKQ